MIVLWVRVECYSVLAASEKDAGATVVHPPGMLRLAVLHVSVLEESLHTGKADIAAVDTSHSDALRVLVVDGRSC
jgi:hypothetical protein